MRFNRASRLDTSQVSDRRGGMSRVPGGKIGAAGGGLGLLGVAVVVIVNLLSGGQGSGDVGGMLQQMLGADSSGADHAVADNSELETSCRTGADANANDDCAVVAIVNSVQSYWTSVLGADYTKAPTVFYTGSTATACGVGQAAAGPFYCPGDKTVYIDLSFWNDLETQFGADASTFTQSYVLAHEYGHHVQDLEGTMDRMTTRQGPASDSVRLELQADCYAGTWAKHASTVPGPDGTVLVSDITDTDIANAVATAGKIGDDWIQAHLGGGRADPTTYTHGTSAQRQRWFETGYRTGDPARCDTFSAADLG